MYEREKFMSKFGKPSEGLAVPTSETLSQLEEIEPITVRLPSVCQYFLILFLKQKSHSFYNRSLKIPRKCVYTVCSVRKHGTSGNIVLVTPFGALVAVDFCLVP